MKTTILISMILVAVNVIEAQSTWTMCNSPTTEKLESLFMPGPNTVLAGGASGVLLLSNDNGETFNTVNLGSAEDVNAIWFFNSQNGRMFLGHNFMQTTNGGLNWNSISSIPGNPKAMYFLTADTGFVACDDGEAYSTFNGGVSWNLLSTGVSERLDAVFFKSIGDGFFGGRNSTSLRTFDQGVTFTAGGIPANGDIKDIQFVNSANGYTCGDNGEILFSGDGGTNWSQQNTPTSAFALDALHFTDELNGWSTGEGGVIFHTNDGGITWFSDISNTTNELNNVHLFDSDHGFAVGDNGTVVRLGSSTTSINDKQRGSNSFTAAPNPFHDQFTITSSGTGVENSVLTLCDLTGRIFHTAVITGSGIITTIAAPGLKSGIYICRIRSNENIYTVKLVKN